MPFLIFDMDPSGHTAKHGSATIAYNTASIGLKNLDPESETYRVYKQLIERLNVFRWRYRFLLENGQTLVTDKAILIDQQYAALQPPTAGGQDGRRKCLGN